MPRQLVSTSEDWHVTEDRFLHRHICWEKDGNIYYTQHPERSFDLNTLKGELVCKSDLYARAFPETSAYTRAPNPLPEDSHVKKQNIADIRSHKPAGNMLVTEIKSCEVIRAHPHPNLVEYRGYICDDGYITALCFKKYKIGLERALKLSMKINYSIIIEDARNGMNHLHSLGLVHVSQLGSVCEQLTNPDLL